MAERAGKGSVMHEQAFHTCCRHGLGANSGFQYNAASPGLTQEVLSRLALVHAGYQAPRDVPAEPTPDQLHQFPISLRYRPVEGAGPVLSRTAYVGREFRGRDGEPDTGRFGNYFSHIVVGSDGEDPFDGLLPIELWDADHWSIREAPEPALARIETLAPGPLDLERALAELTPGRVDWIPAVVSAAVSAIAGGPRAVLVEEAGARAAAWVALVCFALPRALSSRLTFSTFEGRPRYVDLHLTLTTPGCDVAFPSHELGQQVRLLDLGDGVPSQEGQALLGRVIGALAIMGAEALSATARAVQASGCADASLGAAFAVLGGRCDLVNREDDVCEILRLLAAWQRSELGEGVLGGAASVLCALPQPQTSQPVLAGWWRLYAAARQGGHSDSPGLLDVSLGVLLDHIDELEPADELVSGYAPVRPTVARLAEFLDLLHSTEDGERTGARIAAGWQLGLVGANEELDRRFAGVMADHLGHPAVTRAFASICIDPRHHHLVCAVVAALLERAAGDPAALAELTALSAEQEIVEDALRDILRRSESFGIVLTGARAELTNWPHSRNGLLRRLVSLARDEYEQNLIKTLYGPPGPVEIEDRVELLEAYADRARTPLAEDLRAGWQTVASWPLHTDASRLEPLVQVLLQVDPEARRQPVYISWEMLVDAQRGSAQSSLDTWMRQLSWVSINGGDLPDEYHAALATATLRRVLPLPDDEHRARFVDAMEIVDQRTWIDCCERELARYGDRTIASLFTAWAWAQSAELAGQRLMLETLLPSILEQASRRKSVAECLAPELHRRWRSWNDAHPPHRAVVGRVPRIRRKGG